MTRSIDIRDILNKSINNPSNNYKIPFRNMSFLIYRAKYLIKDLTTDTAYFYTTQIEQLTKLFKEDYQRHLLEMEEIDNAKGDYQDDAMFTSQFEPLNEATGFYGWDFPDNLLSGIKKYQFFALISLIKCVDALNSFNTTSNNKSTITAAEFALEASQSLTHAWLYFGKEKGYENAHSLYLSTQRDAAKKRHKPSNATKKFALERLKASNANSLRDYARRLTPEIMEYAKTVGFRFNSEDAAFNTIYRWFRKNKSD